MGFTADRSGNRDQGVQNAAEYPCYQLPQGKPELLHWATGTDAYAAPDAVAAPYVAATTHISGKVFAYVSGATALLSIADVAGVEKPYIIPPGVWREIPVAGGIASATAFTAKNLVAGSAFSSLIVEVS
jgi:hypothetical protein